MRRGVCDVGDQEELIEDGAWRAETETSIMLVDWSALSRLYMKPDDMGMGLKSCISVFLLELVRILLQYKWGPSFGVNGSGGLRS